MSLGERDLRIRLASSPTKGLSLDALGTLVELVPPTPLLANELRHGWNLECSATEIERALRAEISYYKTHHLEGFDGPSLVDLRLRCSGVLHEKLPKPVRERIDPVQLMPAFLRSLRFRPFRDTIAALKGLRSAGLSLVVVSNWDISLGAALEQCGVGQMVDHVVSSAAVGTAKPSPAVFERGLELLGLPASSVVHVGDTPELDITGAEAAGIAPVLICRDPDLPSRLDPHVPTIATLPELLPV